MVFTGGRGLTSTDTTTNETTTKTPEFEYYYDYVFEEATESQSSKSTEDGLSTDLPEESTLKPTANEGYGDAATNTHSYMVYGATIRAKDGDGFTQQTITSKGKESPTTTANQKLKFSTDSTDKTEQKREELSSPHARRRQAFTRPWPFGTSQTTSDSPAFIEYEESSEETFNTDKKIENYHSGEAAGPKGDNASHFMRSDEQDHDKANVKSKSSHEADEIKTDSDLQELGGRSNAKKERSVEYEEPPKDIFTEKEIGNFDSGEAAGPKSGNASHLKGNDKHGHNKDNMRSKSSQEANDIKSKSELDVAENSNSSEAGNRNPSMEVEYQSGIFHLTKQNNVDFSTNEGDLHGESYENEKFDGSYISHSSIQDDFSRENYDENWPQSDPTIEHQIIKLLIRHMSAQLNKLTKEMHHHIYGRQEIMDNHREKDYTSRKSPSYDHQEMKHYKKQDHAHGQVSDRRYRHHFWKAKPFRKHHRRHEANSQSMEDKTGGRSPLTRSVEEDSTRLAIGCCGSSAALSLAASTQGQKGWE